MPEWMYHWTGIGNRGAIMSCRTRTNSCTASCIAIIASIYRSSFGHAMILCLAHCIRSILLHSQIKVLLFVYIQVINFNQKLSISCGWLWWLLLKKLSFGFGWHNQTNETDALTSRIISCSVWYGIECYYIRDSTFLYVQSKITCPPITCLSAPTASEPYSVSHLLRWIFHGVVTKSKYGQICCKQPPSV